MNWRRGHEAPNRATAHGFAVALVLGSVALGPRAAAAPGRLLEIAPSPVQPALSLELAADGLWVNACAKSPCAARAGRRLDLPGDAAAASAQGALVELAPWPDRRLAHVRVALVEGAWEALVAAPPGALEARVIWSGYTGPRTGEEGERHGESVWIRDDDRGARVLIGSVREDVALCGRTTLLEPRLLDRDFSLRPAKVQQLSVAERRAAPVLEAVRVDGAAPPGANALRALSASSAIGDPRALTDGRADTSWSEGRGGEGRGEFVVFRPLGSLIALDFLVRSDGEAVPSGAAPRVLWWVSRDQIYRIDFAEDAWQKPGAWYRVRFPAPLDADCAALVLEQAHREQPDTRVSLAELRGVGELSTLAPAELVGRLSTPGDAGAAAVPALLQAGPAGVAAVLGVFGALDNLGRSRALDVIEPAPCETVASAYVDLLASSDVQLARRAEQRLQQCGPAASASLRAAFDAASPEAGAKLGRALVSVDPALAVELVGARLAASAREHRPLYRDLVARLAQQAGAEPGLRRLLGSSGLGVSGEVEVLRALGAALPRFVPEASGSLARAMAAAQSFAERYVLLAPAALLAGQDPNAAAFVDRALADEDEYLRLSAARLAPEQPALQARLIAGTRDSAMRVREASVVRLGEQSSAAALPVLIERLAEDDWPLVRAAAAKALAVLGPSPPADEGLAEAVEDSSASVRLAALRALGRRGASQFGSAVEERFSDRSEEALVRAAAATALGDLCDASALDALTRAALRLLDEHPHPEDVVVGVAALTALGRLAPKDLPERLAPFGSPSRPPGVAAWLERAQTGSTSCRVATPVKSPRSRKRRR